MDEEKPKQEDTSGLFEEPWGEVPAGIEEIPGVITVQPSPNPSKLEESARSYLAEHPEIVRRARKLGHDIVAHRTEIMFGAGLASVIGGIVLYSFKRKGRKR